MINQQELHRLAAIERHLRAEDLDLERRLQWPSSATVERSPKASLLVLLRNIGRALGPALFNLALAGGPFGGCLGGECWTVTGQAAAGREES